MIAGRYRLEERLGRGGMSEVWAATDTELERRVALKLLSPNADNARFEREARAVASLGHPNITQLYDYGEENGRPYMVLEYLPGGTLEEHLQSGKPLPDDDVRRIAAELAAGLAHAHARGVVHRDLKPANVLFDQEGRAKLADFGIARMVAGEGTFTEAGTVLGTAAYISPEQAAGSPASAASDVYSFGVMLYRMLTGRLPFESNDPMELVMLHRDSSPPPVTELRDDAPALLESTTTAAMAKDPADRPADGAALLAALGVPTGLSSFTTTVSPPGDDTHATRVLPVAAAALPAAAGRVWAADRAAAQAQPRPAPRDRTARPPARRRRGRIRADAPCVGIAVRHHAAHVRESHDDAHATDDDRLADHDDNTVDAANDHAARDHDRTDDGSAGADHHRASADDDGASHDHVTAGADHHRASATTTAPPPTTTAVTPAVTGP